MGRRLDLKYNATPENASKFAADIVVATKEINGVDLNYSVSSLELVDKIISGFRDNGCSANEIAETLFSFGCYVGEVFVRNAQGKWMKASETEISKVADFPLVIQTPGYVCNPIGKVFKRLINGEGDNLPFFYTVFTQK